MGSVVYTWTDVLTLQRAVSDDYKLLDPAVQACNVQKRVTDDDLNAWDVMQGRVAAYTRLDASSISAALSLDTIVEQGKALQADLLKWHAKVRAMGCPVADAPTPTVPQSGFGDFASGLGDLLKNVPTVLVLAVLYLVLSKKR